MDKAAHMSKPPKVHVPLLTWVVLWANYKAPQHQGEKNIIAHNLTFQQMSYSGWLLRSIPEQGQEVVRF